MPWRNTRAIYCEVTYSACLAGLFWNEVQIGLPSFDKFEDRGCGRFLLIRLSIRTDRCPAYFSLFSVTKQPQDARGRNMISHPKEVPTMEQLTLVLTRPILNTHRLIGQKAPINL